MKEVHVTRKIDAEGNEGQTPSKWNAKASENPNSEVKEPNVGQGIADECSKGSQKPNIQKR